MGLRCLLVDDSDGFLASARRLLEAQGMRVVGCAGSGAEALALAERLRPDVTLVDVELGDEDGVAVGREVALRVPETQVVLISAHGLDELGDIVPGSRAAGFLPKTSLGAAAIEALLTHL